MATVRELTAKLEAIFDRWLRGRMEQALPHLNGDIARMFDLYERERRTRPEDRFEQLAVDNGEPDPRALLQERSLVDEDDEGSAETFFAWFFRGKGPEGYLSGAAFQKNRLASTSSVYATLFEDDHVAWLLGRPDDALAALCEARGQSAERILPRLRARAYRHFQLRSQRAQGYPRLYVFQSYQTAALEMLAKCGGTLGDRAEIVLEERYPGPAAHGKLPDAPGGFPQAAEAIGIETFLTELRRRPALRTALWPDDVRPDFRASFRRREQRRELLSAMVRLGASYIDLYCLAMQPLGSFSLGGQVESERAAADLAVQFADLLERQAGEPGFHAFCELSGAAENFDLLHAVNFPEVAGARLHELAAVYGATLQRQMPVGSMAGGVNKRLVRQFRMPGFPLVLVSTDVLQEGEDLHTFCRRVVHYGITWTPSAMEQRTGRVDRIGSLVQRRLDGTERVPAAEEWLQVFYPHLRDTVEVLQVRRVLRRLNRFLQLITKTVGQEEDRSSRIDAGHELLDNLPDVLPVKGPLESAFPVDKAWLAGDLLTADVKKSKVQALADHLEQRWEGFCGRFAVESRRDSRPLSISGTANLIDARIGLREELDDCKRVKQFRVHLRSQAAGEETLLRCTCRVGKLDLRDDRQIDRLYKLQRDVGGPKMCVRRSERDREDMVSIEGDNLFHPDTSDPDELEALVSRVVCAAAALRPAIGLPVEERTVRRGGGRRRRAIAKETADPGDVLAMADGLIERGRAQWTRSGPVLDVLIGRTGRRQKVEIGRRDGICVLRSVVVPARFVMRNNAHRRRVAYRAWRRNAEKELVALGFDRRDQLVGVVEQPVATMAAVELRFYVEMLARECDRFEYFLTGGDVG